jgi:acetyl-CoA carboxylase biotin carboxylase subunit
MPDLPKKLLIANRGEIARRINRTAQALGIPTVAVHSEVDRALPFVREADETVCIGEARPTDTYLDVAKLLQVLVQHGCDAVHPGYGFLSENTEFARNVTELGASWVGPTPEVILSMGNKVHARAVASLAGLPVGEAGTESVTDLASALSDAERLGYPVMVKAADGGGGIGMARANDPAELEVALTRTKELAERSFGSSEVFLEHFVESARHVEVQVFGAPDGVMHVFGERDCSTQRRHQKVVEETPAPMLAPELRSALHRAAHDLAASIGYTGAGTVEFLVDKATQTFVFLEMNTRLQVEHPVTEAVYGVDLVEQQLRAAVGGTLTLESTTTPTGAALEFRLYAEDPVRFFPSPGTIDEWREPAGEGIRIDAGFEAGNIVSPFYDPLLAKIIVWGETREQALDRARRALEEFIVTGIKTNLPFLRALLQDEAFVAGDYDTNIIPQMQERRRLASRA